MKKTIFLFFLFFQYFAINANDIILSDSAQISLLTCSPAELAYEKFGHTAIRIYDPSQQLDVIFNYGIFSFLTDNFYYKFVKGETDYVLGVATTNDFLYSYAVRGSGVKEQVLNLTNEEKQKLFNALLINYEPGNREYRYNFIYDNCSTRARDIIVQHVDGRVNYTSVSSYEDYTFREYIAHYVGKPTWLMFGIDIVFGANSDKVVDRSTSMFLPEILLNEFDAAHIIPYNSFTEKRPLVSKTKVLVVEDENRIDKNPLWFFSPLAIAIFIFIIALFVTIRDLKRRRNTKIFDCILYIITGLVGWIVFYLSFISIHPIVDINFNLLWLNPFNVVLAFLIYLRPARSFVAHYHLLNIFLILSALIVYSIGIQGFNIAFVPIILSLLIRSISRVNIGKNFIKKNAVRIKNDTLSR